MGSQLSNKHLNISSETRFYTEFIILNSLVLIVATELLQFHVSQTMLCFQNFNIKPADEQTKQIHSEI